MCCGINAYHHKFKIFLFVSCCTDDGVKLTVNDFLIKAAALTLEVCWEGLWTEHSHQPLSLSLSLSLQRLPESNSSWGGEGLVRRLPSVDISVAVATDGGLITPIVSGANRLTVQQISAQVKVTQDGHT